MSWTVDQARETLRRPHPNDTKYRRGVLAIRTGSVEYPGAAVLGVEAALRTGVGMVRYLGDAATLVLQRRPEIVTQSGQFDALLIGSGMAHASATDLFIAQANIEAAPVIADAGALDPIVLRSVLTRPLFLTPHVGEAARLLGQDIARVDADPANAAAELAASWNATVVLKGHRTVIAHPERDPLTLSPATARLASAGTGDVLAGILAALVASTPDGDPIALAATAVTLHSLAAERIAGPILALELAEQVSPVIADLWGSEQ